MTAEAPAPRYVVVVDFDGTAAEDDVQQVILDTFADRDAWRRINREWADGHMTTAQRARRQWALVTASEQEILASLDPLRLDSGFPAFARLCADRGYPLYVVSDGFDFYIWPLLRRAGLDHLPVIANSLRFADGEPHFSFLLQRSPDQYYGNDKTYVIEQVRQQGTPCCSPAMDTRIAPPRMWRIWCLPRQAWRGIARSRALRSSNSGPSMTSQRT